MVLHTENSGFGVLWACSPLPRTSEHIGYSIIVLNALFLVRSGLLSIPI